ncbi:major facilitator superfamily domain-containing protein [Coniella lustricola]|uniref:Major facilitator superfamily domain-containing protein n=1 Tax=Coniella lustricola TaxID=2025994 RepID=A0A2T3A859_9PEZI|nr:major facilitator superfamily domain-containing protein [Coniella lustricola]
MAALVPSLRRVAAELGITTITTAPRDLHLILLTRCLRMAAYGGASLVLALFFAALDVSDTRIGLFMTLTLLGDVALSLLLTLIADAAGRRRILLLGCVCMALAGCVFALASNYWLLLFAAVVGVISVSGNEIGPFRAVEESVLAGLVDDKARSDVFAWYVVLGTFGSALGLLAAGTGVEALKSRGHTELDAFRAVFWGYAVIGIAKAIITSRLSAKCEVQNENTAAAAASRSSGRATATADEAEDESELAEFLADSASESDEDEQEGGSSSRRATETTLKEPEQKPKPKMGFAQLSSKTRWTLLRLCGLFAIDSLASGMVPYSLINFYMDRKFQQPKNLLGDLMAVVWIMSSIGNIFASAISKRIGLIRTMVFTHLPSAIFLAMLPLPQVFWLAVVLLVARGTLASMDQAPRTAFLSKVVRAEERTAVMGIVNVVKTLSQSGGPLFTGLLAGGGRFWIAFTVAGALKASYDLGLLAFFLKTEREAAKVQLLTDEEA